MFRTLVRAGVGLAAVSLIATGLCAPAGASARTATQGVTDKEIDIVALVADLTGLRNQGINLPPKLTTENLTKRWQSLADDYGPINGRKIVIKPAVWNPVDNTTFDKACIQATQDNKPFLVVNGNGYRQSSVACITVDNNTPMFYGESVYGDLQKASGKNLVSLGVPAETSAKAAADVAKSEKLIPTTAKIGILTGNEPATKVAGETLQSELKKNGFNVAKVVEVNTLAADATANNRESSAAVATFQSAGVDTVYILIPFTSNQGYFQESQRTGASFKNFIVDTASSLCTQFGASRTPLEAAGTPCLTTWDTRALATKDGIKKDNAFEAQCRAQFDKAFNEKTQPGVPAGDVTAGGVTYTEDLAPNECTQMALLLPAIKKAGKNLTWDKVYANLLKTTKAPAAYMSNGEGGFAKNKQYFVNQVHLMSLAAANAQTPKDANGLFNGCPAPVNCWIPQLVGGEEWFPIAKG